MDFKQIQELIKIINKSNIGEISIEEKDFKVTIKQKKEEKITQVIGAAQSVPVYSAPPPVAQQQSAAAPQADKAKAAAEPARARNRAQVVFIVG